MTHTAPDFPRAGLPRRLAALSYDALVLTGLLFFATVLSTAFEALVLGVTDSGAQGRLSGHPLHQLYLLAWWFGYYGLSMVKAGQTVGMRPWRLKAQRLDGGLMSWKAAALRFATGLLGLSSLSLLLDSGGLALHDKLSLTEVVVLPKKKAL
ncbi:MAG: RDD family protein [Gammaproteobacteria bacterium]|nr:RDD family protein [Gammaproteobacteria bacterium]